MRAYVDSSVLLRVVLRAPQALREWQEITEAVACGLLQIECLRAIDRLQLTGELKRDEVSPTFAALHAAMDRIFLLKFTNEVVARAGQSSEWPSRHSTQFTWQPRCPGATGSAKAFRSPHTMHNSQRPPGRWASKSSAPNAAARTLSRSCSDRPSGRGTPRRPGRRGDRRWRGPSGASSGRR